ncbi:glycosyltransferase family 2 protein [Corallococcus terminator]|uniref:Glycosyltransferase family 2 protein n=1 Tax=Corallococcus terminator TaxID=2316733 RepID=A0A3A8J3K5_9BACT|nr:glycosyltransferase family A protein [Corallococcus terminator]RKG90252.1 glycosyltransferase family 2 protein [Corallococcus terminator]
MPLFSVVIPTYNRASLLEETLASVFAQTLTDHEVIVVDDGSTDGTLALLARYGERIRVLRQDNAGQGVARNLGIREARGEYVAFLDSDDLWPPWTLATFQRVLQEQGRPTLVMGRARSFQAPGELSDLESGPLVARSFADYLASAEANFIRTACAVAVRTEALRRVGGFSAKRISSEDYDLLYRLGVEPGFVFVESPVTLGYRQHPESSSRDLDRGYEGTLFLLSQERHGAYPGGSMRRRERLALLLFGLRHVTHWLLEHGRRRQALTLYARGLRFHRALPRWRYLLGFPPWALATSLRPRR